MKKQPKLVLRESAILDVSRSWSPGRFVEMGAGTGHMTRIFLERGFHGACHDLGDDSRDLMRQGLADAMDRVQVVDQLEQLEEGGFDYLMAFEVLEHIEDDLGVFKQWLRYLKPGGHILVSVPAHQRKFGRSDHLVGHVRRYEREQLTRMLVAAGLTGIKMINYGFPITELTRTMSNRIVRDDYSYDDMTPVERSICSAQAKPRKIAQTLSMVSGAVVTPFCLVQRWFYRFDLGDGLVATAIKPREHPVDAMPRACAVWLESKGPAPAWR
jgi:SAM-dependent methyltransferase